jgi:DNA-binding FrmR family transcriptional regulator
MLSNSQQRDLVARLNRVEGQIRGIRRMIEEPRLCVEILQQLAAAEAAVGRVSHAILKYHVEHCVPESVSRGNDEHLSSLTELVDIFERFSR